MSYKQVATILASALATVGCSSVSGHFTKDGFSHDDLGYTVRYATPQSSQILGPEWKLDNYVLDENGAPKDLRDDESHTSDIEGDFVKDSEPEKLEDVALYDLRLKHTKTPGVIWISAIPLSRENEEKYLDTFVDYYISSLTFSSWEAVVAGQKARGEVKRYASTVVSRTERTVSGSRAIEAVIEIADLDQLKMDNSSRVAELRVIFLKPPISREYQASIPTRRRGERWTVERPVLMLIGHANTPRYFNTTNPQMDTLITNLRLPE